MIRPRELEWRPATGPLLLSRVLIKPRELEWRLAGVDASRDNAGEQRRSEKGSRGLLISGEEVVGLLISGEEAAVAERIRKGAAGPVDLWRGGHDSREEAAGPVGLWRR